MAKERIETDRFILHREVDERGAIVSSEFEMPDGTRMSEREYVAAANLDVPPAWYADQQQPFAARREPFARIGRLEVIVRVLAAIMLAQLVVLVLLWLR